MHSPTAQLLRARTAESHQRVETGLDLLGPGLTTARLADVLERFYGFWAATEPAVTEWLAAQPEHAAALRIERRGRCAHLRRDLLALGRPAEELPLAPPHVERIDAAAALGWLYVTEGSTLGGAVIERRLGHPGIAFFSPYPEGPGPMWRAFVGHVEGWAAAAPDRVPPLLDAANDTFDALAAWLAPVYLGAAA